MQGKKAAGYILELFIVVAILGVLFAIAIPNVGMMIGKGKVAASESEIYVVQTAVIEMLFDSVSGTLEPVGPIADMSEVHTRDVPPLVLSDYLIGLDESNVTTESTYKFAADGRVTQLLP